MKDITMYCTNARTCNDSDNIVHTHYVTHDQVQCAINKIKPGKSDCIDTDTDTDTEKSLF